MRKKLKIGRGQRLWKQSKTIIAGGNMLFSKRPDTFLPDLWPSYFKTKGCLVTDLDNKNITIFQLCQLELILRVFKLKS